MIDKALGILVFMEMDALIFVGVWRSSVARTLGVGEVARSNRVTPILFAITPAVSMFVDVKLYKALGTPLNRY
jgi:hypothetical protein